MAAGKYASDIVQTTALEQRTKLTTLAYWKPHGSIVFTSSGLRLKQRLSDHMDIANISVELENEQWLQEVGAYPVQTYTGKNATITMTFQGDTMPVIMALLGLDYHTYKVFSPGTYGGGFGKGDLELRSIDSDNNIKVSELYTDCHVRITELPGAGDSPATFAVTFTTRNSFIQRVGKGAWSHEIFWDNSPGAVTGAGVVQYPDGVRTTFTLTYGDYSYSGTPPGTAINNIATDPDATGLSKYFAYVRLTDTSGNMRDVGDDEATYNNTTKVITFTVAPTDDYKLEVAYPVNDDGSGVNYTPAHHVKTGRWSGETWKKYQIE